MTTPKEQTAKNEYRPFKNDLERLGAMRCGRCRKRPSDWVKDIPEIGGRTVLCDLCYIGVKP
jgi:hypothetical protein